MSYWWVNHKQTYKEEVNGGYIWSPRVNRNRARNETYINLTKAEINDIVFSYANGEIKAVGVVTKKFIDYSKPSEFGKVGSQWANAGWLVEIDWKWLNNPFRPREFMDEIIPLLPEKHSPIIKTGAKVGNGNQGCYLASIGTSLGDYMLGIIQKMDTETLDMILESRSISIDGVIEQKIREENIPETDKEQLIKARLGQGIFRHNLENIEKRCRVTGITDKRLLIASHIKPWRESSNKERLDGNNGLLLSPHVDRLFDRGWISFSDDGRILCEDDNFRRIMEKWNLNPNMNVGDFNKNQRYYLAYHREMYKYH